MRLAPATLKGKALQLLAARDYSRAELDSKLRNWLRKQIAANVASQNILEADANERMDESSEAKAQAQEQQLSNLLAELEAKGFLNDQRTAENLLHRKASKLGTARLRHELQRKGIDQDTSAALLQDMAGSELQRAKDLWQKKFGAPPNTPNDRARQMRFLASRGFGGEVVRKVLQQANDNPDE